jgi:hypothetical protein
MNPTILFHASQNKNIQEFEPRNETIRDDSEGPVIFATPDKAYASCFIVPSDDSWVKISRYGDRPEWHLIVCDKSRFMKADNGGAIYTLPIDGFSFDIAKNMGHAEWTSTKKVRPFLSESFDSGLQAMIELGVKVHFVDEDTFRKIEDSEDHGEKIVSRLPSYQNS